MELINALPKQITLGNQGESGITTIDVDCTAWLTDFPTGTFAVTFIPPDQYRSKLLPATQAYLLPDGTTLRIIVKRNMTQYSGKGSLVIRLAVGDDTEKRSAVAGTYVVPGHDTAMDEMPADVEDWATEATQKLAEIMARMGFVPKGDYNAATEYKHGDWVSANGGSWGYIWPEPSTGVPLTDTTHWQQIAEKGLKGDAFVYEDFTPEQLDGLVGNGIKSILRTSGDGTPGSVDTYTITFDDDSTTTFLVYNGADGDISNIKVDGATKTKAAGVVDLTSDFARYALWRKTASGNPVSVYPVPESPLYPKVSGTYTQGGTGDPSPENIRPIMPWLASGGTVKVKRTGKNLLNIANRKFADVGDYANSTLRTNIKDDEIYFMSSNNYGYGINPKAFLTETGIRQTYVVNAAGGQAMFIRCKPNTSYTISTIPTPYGFKRMEVSDLGVVSTAGLITTASHSFVTKPYSAFVGAIFYPNNQSTTEEVFNSNIQIELGDVATPYEPYSGEEITLTAPQEIPAGWMDNEAVGAVTGIKTTLNATEIWDDANFAASGYFETTLAVAAHATPGLACSHFLPAASAAADSNKAVLVGASLKIYPADAVATDKTAWLAYLTANPVTIAYTRATPVSITPASAPLPALPQLDRVTPRSNVLTASTGNVELTYAKSPIRESDELAAAIAALS